MATSIELSFSDIKSLCQRYLRKDIDTASHIDDAAKPINLKVLQYELKPTSDAPAGFLGHHNFLNVQIELNKSAQNLSFFTKCAPSDISSRMEYLEEFGVFKKEIRVYRELMPKLESIFASVAPKCYYADNKLLVFENLMQQGFKMAADRSGLLNYEHMHCALKNLAALHAASIAYEVKMGKKLNEIHNEALLENAYPLNMHSKHVRQQNFDNANTVLRELIKQLPKYKTNLDFILENFSKQMSVIFILAQTSQKYQNVVSHADLWANNIMFKYGKFGETPLQCRFVDFQLARYAPPMLDLITLLTIPSSRAFREKYLLELWSEYYGFMLEFLKRENLCVQAFLPKEQFFDSLQEFRIVGLIESMLFSHLTILPVQLTKSLTTSADGFADFFDRKRVEICMKAFQTDAIYRERLTDMLEDFVDRFVLKVQCN